MITSIAANPAWDGVRPSARLRPIIALPNVHTAVRVASRRRPPLYARQVHTQYPRQQPIACTPVARAGWSQSIDRFVEAHRFLDYLLSHTISVV
jgi:hypothetical protein